MLSLLVQVCLVDEDKDLAQQIVIASAVPSEGIAVHLPSLEIIVVMIGPTNGRNPERIFEVNAKIRWLHGNRICEQRQKHLSKRKNNNVHRYFHVGEWDRFLLMVQLIMVVVLVKL